MMNYDVMYSCKRYRIMAKEAITDTCNAEDASALGHLNLGV